MNLYDLPSPWLKRESIFTHHEAKHHQGENLACVGLVMIMMMSMMWVMMMIFLMIMITRHPLYIGCWDEYDDCGEIMMILTLGLPDGMSDADNQHDIDHDDGDDADVDE